MNEQPNYAEAANAHSVRTRSSARLEMRSTYRDWYWLQHDGMWFDMAAGQMREEEEEEVMERGEYKVVAK